MRREGCGSRRTLFHLTRTRLRAGLRVSQGWASVRTSCTLDRHLSEIRTGCANERPSGSVRGAASNGCPYRDRQSSVSNVNRLSGGSRNIIVSWTSWAVITVVGLSTLFIWLWGVVKAAALLCRSRRCVAIEVTYGALVKHSPRAECAPRSGPGRKPVTSLRSRRALPDASGGPP